MRKPAIPLVTCIFLIGSTLAFAQSPGVGREIILRGVGSTMTCATWLTHRADASGLFAARARERYASSVSWVLGYLSGAARYGQDLSPLRVVDEDGVVAWLVAACERDPELGLRRALDAFVEAHPDE